MAEIIHGASKLLKNYDPTRFREGHDFSRAVKSSRTDSALAPEVRLWPCK